MNVDVVLPVLDEEEALPWVLSRLPEGYHPIVVDNNSRDHSAEVARRHGAEVVRCTTPGYGAAVHTGIEAGRGSIVVVLDADGSIDPAELPRLVEALPEKGLVLGRRRSSTIPLPARIANRALAHLLSSHTGKRIEDLGPVRVAHREALLALPIEDRRSGYPVETVVQAAAAGWDVVQEDITYHPRIGRSKVTGTPRGYLQAVMDTRRVLSRLPRSGR